MYHEIVVAGVAISLIFAELTGLSPAGLIVPGYIALSMQTPRRVCIPWLWLWLPGGAPACCPGG